MSVPNRRIRRRKSDKSSLQILEEAFHLLRVMDLRHFWWFYVGAIPFAVAMLYFVADMSRSSFAARDGVWISIVMVTIYFWMRWCQKRFCRGLWETISPGQLPDRTRAERFRSTAAYFFLEALALPILAIGLFFAIPLGWTIAMLQNLPVLAGASDMGKPALRNLFSSSLKQSHYEWAQNHGILLILLIVAFFTWINLVATCVIVPGFVKSFFGVESIFTVSPIAATMNTTFFLGSLLLTWLVISPMAKAAYTLRCFYAESRSTGADLLSRLADCRKAREADRESSSFSASRGTRAALVVLGCFFLQGAVAEEEIGTVGSGSAEVNAESLEESIGETMQQKKYQWKLSRKVTELDENLEESWLSRQIREIAEGSRQAFRDLGDWIKEMLQKATRDQRRSSERSGNSGSSFFDGISSTLSFGLVVLVVGLASWIVYLVYRKYRGEDRGDVEDAVETGVIDLQSEDIVASQLPEDEWMRLAREQMAKGDPRLAIRALFLATLAHLGEQGVIQIAKFKSNRDYRRELDRRARKIVDLRTSFEENTRMFERSWYGWHPVGDDTISSFLENHETIARESRKVVSRIGAERQKAVATR